MQGIEIRDAINPKDHSLAIQHKPLLADFAGRLNDPRITVSPVCSRHG